MANLQLENTDSIDSIKAQKLKKQVFSALISARKAIYFCLEQALLKEKVAQHASKHGVLLVRVDDIPQADEKGSVLTQRQKRWLNAPPFDSTTQNPVVYK